MVEAASFEGPLLPWSSTPSARGCSFELSLLLGERLAAVPNLLGEARAASRRPVTELAGLFEAFAAFADYMMIGIFYEQLEAVRTRTYDGLGGLRRAGRVCGEQDAELFGRLTIQGILVASCLGTFKPTSGLNSTLWSGC